MQALRWLCGGICAGVLLAGAGASLWHAILLVAAGVLLGLAGVGAGEGALGVAIGLIAVLGVGQGPVLNGRVSIEGVSVGAPVGGTTDVALTRWTRPGEPWRAVQGRVRVRARDGIPPGQRVLAYGTAGPLVPATSPGAPDPSAGASRVGIRTVIRASVVTRFTPSDPRVLPGTHGAVLTALATGHRGDVPDRTWSILRRTGTAHLLAISGFHVGLVGGLATGVASLWFRAIALRRPQGVPRGASIVMGVLVALAYAHLAGLPISAQRAASLLVLAGFARATGRTLDGLSALMACAAGVLLVDPAAASTAGFQLSFGAVLGLIRVAPAFERLIPLDLPRPVDWTLRSLSISTAASIGTFPASALWFQDVALVSPASNLIAMPVVGLVVAPCALIGAILPDVIAPVPLWIADTGFGALLWVLDPMAIEPIHPAVTPIGACVLMGAVCLPRHYAWVATVLTATFGLSTVPTQATVTFLDVGQGDAAVVSHTDGSHWLIDAGPPSTTVLSWLRRQGIRRLDVVAVSHGHDDHIGSLPQILEQLEVGALWVPSRGEGLDELLNQARSLGIQVVEDPPGTWTCGDGDINERSLVVGTAGVLFSGDIGVEGEHCLASALPSFPVLKVPHHGSGGSSSPSFLATVRPTLAVISAGRGNVFSHPRDEALQRLQSEGAQVVRTDVRGTIELRVRPHTVQLRTFRGRWSDWRGVPIRSEPSNLLTRR